MKRATISDVAAHAGVTKSTVSHALSGKRPVAPETRERVDRAIQALGYRPNPVAQPLASGRSRTVGFVYPLYGPEFGGLEMRFIAGAAAVINQANYAFVLLTLPDRRADNLTRFIQSGLLDGVILMQVQMHDLRVELLKRTGPPFVLIGRCQDNTGLTFIDLDIAQGIHECVEHLVALGHRNLAYLRLADTELGFAARAAQAYEAACRQHDLSVAAPACELTTESGARVAAELLAKPPETTALIVWNDIAALGAAHAAQALGRRVPEDLSLICFDLSTVANMMPFKPTVVDICPRELAAEAARMLIAQLEERGPAAAQVLMAPKLMLGETTMRPSRREPGLASNAAAGMTCV